MTISIKASRKTKQVLIGLENVKERHHKALRLAWHDVGEEVVKEIKSVLTTGPRTGKWYKYKGVPYQASAPGEAPAKRSGALSKSGDYAVRSWREMAVGEKVEYAKMEDNWGRIKARPHIIKAVNNKKQETVTIIQDALDRELKH